MKELHIKKDIYRRIVELLGKDKVESGGIIAVDESGTVCDFYFCKGNSAREFIVDPKIFNPQICAWYESGLEFAGIIHSHPNGLTDLSVRDEEYAHKILDSNPFMHDVKMGIVATVDNVIKLKMFSVRKGHPEILPIIIN